MVIPDQRCAGVCIGADNPQRLDPSKIQRQHTVVFQKDSRLLRCLQGERKMLRTFDYSVRDIVKLRIIEQSQQKAGREQSDSRLCDPFL